MEAPPQFPGAPKKSKTGLILGGLALAVVLCCCGCGGAFFFFGKNALKGGFGMVGCSIAMDQQREALLAYAKKNGGKLPAAANWQDSIKPYVVKMADQDQPGQPFTIPGPTDDFCDKEAGTSIVFNSALAGKKVADFKDPMGTIALFEVAGRGRNKSAAFTEAPFTSSPILVMSERRGWIRQPLKGEPAVKGKTGRVKPVPTAGSGPQFDMGE